MKNVDTFQVTEQWTSPLFFYNVVRGHGSVLIHCTHAWWIWRKPMLMCLNIYCGRYSKTMRYVGHQSMRSGLSMSIVRVVFIFLVTSRNCVSMVCLAYPPVCGFHRQDIRMQLKLERLKEYAGLEVASLLLQIMLFWQRLNWTSGMHLTISLLYVNQLGWKSAPPSLRSWLSLRNVECSLPLREDIVPDREV